MSEPDDREERIFAKALALPTGERQRFIVDACQGDAELLTRLEALLHADESAGRFMAGQAAYDTQDAIGDLPSVPVMDETAGTMIGRYKLLQKLGEGGCGIVWMAEQEEPVRRRVALKIIKLGMDTKEVIARFDAERQALAMLDHPNIAKILDAGATEAGRPFFAMELVRGVKITDFCDQFNLSTRQRLELFSQVCHAVQHAHQKGIIHRDLKPSNILVTVNDGVPVPKVIDFGIAKATEGRLTDQTLFTAFEQFIGTPAYMSPEQAELSGIDVDTRSDIYSLGVLLYELLTGRPPFDPKSMLRAGLDEIRRIIREVEPPRPSSNLSTLGDADRAQVARLRGTDAARLSMLLRGDLDWIVMRCLEKNRTRRYETPNALAADISRHLHNEPVVARPPSRLYRLNRLVRRNRLAFAAIASVALALLAGSIISTLQAVRATRAEREAELERARAVAERARAEDLLKFMLGDLYTQLDKVGRLDVLDAVADKATAYFASLSPEDLSDTTQLSRARALRLLGGVRMSQARYAEAAAAFSGAYERAADLAARHPKDSEALLERAKAEFKIGNLHWRRAELSAASDWITRYRDTGAALVALDPARQDWQLELADGQFDLAVLSDRRGEVATARSSFLAVLTTLQKMIASSPGNLDLRFREANANGSLGNLAERQGEFAEALKQYSTQAAQLEYIAQADPKTAEWRHLQAIAVLYGTTISMITGQYPAADESLAQARKLLDAVVAHDPANVVWRGTSYMARLGQATMARQRGDIADAGRMLDESLPQLESMSAGEPTEHIFATLLMKAWRLKAQLQSMAGQADAAASATKAAAVAEKLSRAEGATDDELGQCARAFVVLGDVAAKSGDAGEARRNWLRAAALLAPRTNNSRDWRLLDPAARAAAGLGRSAEARATIEKLTLLGYVPLDPWPDLDRPADAKSSDPQPK
jgi:serine/threonine protein kinase